MTTTVTPYSIQGSLVFDYGLPAAGITVRLYNVGFAGQDVKLGESRSDGQGKYSLSYEPPQGQVPNLQLRAVDSQNNEVIISMTRFNAQKQEVLNLVVPGSVQPLAPEYQRLAADMDKHIGGIEKLGQVQESADRQDLRLLYQTTGWDARLLALASSAAGLVQTTGLGQDVLYALLRAGLPTDPQKLALVSPVAIGKALAKANQSGIVSLNDQQISAATTTFQSFASKTRLTLTAPGANSTFGDLLSKSGLNPAQQSSFADLFFSQPSTADGFWQKAAGLGIPAESLNALKLQGKLSYLTFNNADLVQKLQQQIGSLDNLSQLPEQDLHTNTAWKNFLTAMAGPNNPQALDKLIPSAYGGATTTDRLEAYAADLARKVRLSFPTQVVSRMIEKGDLALDANNAPKVTIFLKNAAPLGFQLGRTPLNSFINQNQASLFQGIASGDVAATTESVKTLHRLYQITPSNESLQSAVKLGFTSALDVAAFDSQDFLDRFGKAFPSLDEATLVYRKAQQINSVTLNLYTAARQLDNGPAVYALSPSPSVREDAKAALIKQFPSMQSLFGSLDFCECEDCRSVLSPAAYLVDLLRFLDSDDAQKPYDVLVSRRPDLPNLPLTCENTNTILPYIDVVNEIFEYYIVNGQLDAGAAYDSGAALSQDLVAEPQNILPEAYTALYNAHYPLGLPFDLWIETVRGFLEYFKTPLWSLLDTFKAADPLELFSDSNHYAYYRAGILAEYLGISPAEYALFTTNNPLASWFTLYGYSEQGTASSEQSAETSLRPPSTGLDASGKALSELKSAGTLASKLGVSYQDLVNLVHTGFLNPQLNNLITLQKLGIPLEYVFRYEGQSGYAPMTAAEKAAFERLLDRRTKKFNPSYQPPQSDGTPDKLPPHRLIPSIPSSGFDARTWLSTTWKNGGFNQILLLADPATGCDFAETTLQYANGTAATPSLFLKLNLFVRLWKKLGWTLEETDRALQVFLTPNIPPDSDAHFSADFSAAMQTALVYLAHLETLFQKLQPGPAGRNGLLTLWSNLPTTGDTPLYAQLFNNSSTVNSDPVFDDPLGNYLAGALLIKDHLLALQGALNLTSDEVELILADAGLDVNTARLSLANVSLLYRYGLLAMALNLTVAAFLELKAISGLKPFAPLSAKPLAVLADDVPWTQTLEFVREAEKVGGSGFAIEDLKYLLRHQYDPAGKYGPDPDTLLQLIRSLSDNIHQIQSENAVPSDPLTFTDEVIKQKIALAFPADVVQTFMAMWTGTVQYTAVQTGVLPANKLDPATLAQFPAIDVSYDPVKQAQQLTFQGVLSDTQKAKIEAVNSSTTLSSLLEAVGGQASSYFQKYFQVSTIGQETIGFLPSSDFDLLFAPSPNGATDDAQKQTQMSQKRGELARAFLPYLQQRLIRQTIVQALASDLGADVSLTDTLSTSANLLSDPTQSGKTLLDAFSGVQEIGVTVTYYSSTDGTGASLVTGTALTADTADINKPKPGSTNSAHFEGHLEVLADGTYLFSAQMDNQNAQAELRCDFLPEPLILFVAPANKAVQSQFTDLKAGIPYHFTLDFHNLGGGDARLLVQGENLPVGPLSELTLYPRAAVDRFMRARVLLAKTLQLIQGFGLTEREVIYLLTNGSDFNNLSFSGLPTQVADDSLPQAAVLFGQFLRLADYAALRQGPAAGSDGLIDVFESARQTFLASADPNASSTTVLSGIYQAVANLTRRRVTAVQATAEQLGFKATTQTVDGKLLVTAPDFTQEKGFKRLWDALQLVQATGIAAGDLAGAAGIIDGTQSQDARAATANNLKNALKAHYTPDAWRSIAQAIFDPLRQEKRDALAAYLVNYLVNVKKLHLQSSEQLFEYFLVDPGMEPVVQTSRLRLALSSVQTFIQRCLLNLEEKVSPSAITAKQWEWLKRYRLWQANREIFLWPENWMEPEWRQDKTDLFQALESALLQGDVTNALVEDAFFDYLKDLEERARLDIVSMYQEEAPNGTLHVIGRNYGKPQKYFYRRFAYGKWTAWEPLKVDIEGDHLVAVVWRDRLHLFWVTFAQKSKAPDPPPQDRNAPSLVQMNFSALTQNLSTFTPQKQVQLQLNWSEYFQGKWSDRRSSDLNRALPIDVPTDFDPLWTYIHAAKEYDGNGNEGAVKVILDYPIRQAFRLVSKNSEPTLNSDNWEPAQHYDYSYPGGGIKIRGPLQVQYTKEIQTQNGQVNQTPEATDTILQQGNGFSLLFCDTPVLPMSTQANNFLLAEAKMLKMPFFYQDSDNDITLFVQPSLTETTLSEYIGFAISVSTPNTNLGDDNWWKGIPLVSQVPNVGPVNPGDPSSIYQVQSPVDWVTHPATALSFGTSLIGQSGRLSIQNIPLRVASSGLSAEMQGNARTAGALSALSGINLTRIGSAGLSPARLQALKTVPPTVSGREIIDPTLNQALGGIS